MSTHPTEATFVVEQAGCASCADRIRVALQPLLDVRDVAIDATADTAAVTARFVSAVSEEAVNAALADASAGSGHLYRVAPGSWRGRETPQGRDS